MSSYKLFPLFATFIFLISSTNYAAINPVYKECMQRGYDVNGDYCVFPDSSQCLIEKFNAGDCGQKWMTDDYCIPEGRYVWDEDRCCEGLVAYLPKDVAGQASCQPKTATFFKKIFSDSFAGIIVLILVLGVVLLFLKKKK